MVDMDEGKGINMMTGREQILGRVAKQFIFN